MMRTQNRGRAFISIIPVVRCQASNYRQRMLLPPGISIGSADYAVSTVQHTDTERRDMGGNCPHRALQRRCWLKN